MRLLVTGGAGFIGSNFVHFIQRERPDWHVTVFDALTYAGNIKNLAGLDDSRYSFIKGDICDEAAIEAAVADADAVVHFAAESHVDNSTARPVAVREYQRRWHLPGSGSCAQARQAPAPYFHRRSLWRP